MMKEKELNDLIKYEQKIEHELDVEKNNVVNDLLNSDISQTNKVFQKRQKIENSLRGKYIKYIKRKNKSYKYDDFEDVDFFDIRDIYFKEKKRNKKQINRFFYNFLRLFS